MILATPRNMRLYRRESKTVTTPEDETVIVMPQQPVAYSRTTGEQYSASPGDYWDQPDDEPLVDSEGEPMILVFEYTGMIDADEYDRG